MNSFLYRVAKAYYSEYQQKISQLSFVFPNRRAGLFFQRYLSEIAGKPLFSPEILTINECFSNASKWQTADRLSMLFRLYSIYREQSKSDETFDSFVFWGEMLLSDFNEVDKYLVDAKQLFTNITDLKEIDDMFDFFSPNQIEAIQQFWRTFIPSKEGITKENFTATWKILFTVYQQFRKELLAENTATEGMICREIAERLKNGVDIEKYVGKQFVFIGFNALNPSENTLMTELQKRGQADFYWDYEATALRDSDNPASMFCAENLLKYPSKLTIDTDNETVVDQQIELIAVPSSVGQAKQVYSILNQLYSATNEVQTENSHVQSSPEPFINTAVVLPDESILIPLLHSFPAQIDKVNVTMGFPLKSTPVSGLIEHIFELQRRMRASAEKTTFYHQTVSNILNHQYVSFLCGNETGEIKKQITQKNLIYIEANELDKNPLLASIFIPQTDVQSFLPYLLNILKSLQSGWQNATDATHDYRLECDFLYQYYITINRMTEIVRSKSAEVNMSMDTLMRITRELTAGISIPFIGEPLDGLQVMGVLETRGLDFENLIITSFNEGTFPAKNNVNSFIPYNLRKGFGLPTAEHQDAITSYNFYRLIHRAKHIYFLYDSRTDGLQTGEVSRFMYQLLYHYNVPVRNKNISFEIGFSDAKAIQIDKSPEVMEKLSKFSISGENAAALSPSSIITYIDCPLKFYLTQVESMKEAEEVMETVESNMFGTLFHKVMENLYLPYKERIVQKTDIEALLTTQLKIDTEIHLAFNTEYFKRKSATLVPLEGSNLLIARVLRKYIVKVLEIDKNYAPFRYISSEEKYTMPYKLAGSGRTVNLKGYIDRVDEKEGHYRIIDYKTGNGDLGFNQLSDAFDKEKDKRPKFVLQTLLYCLLYEHKSKMTDLYPGIFYIRNVFSEGFATDIKDKVNNDNGICFSNYKDEFSVLLTACLEEMFQPEIPFTQTTNRNVCQYCPYTGICNR